MEFMIENKYVIKCNVLLGDNVYHFKTHKGGNLQVPGTTWDAFASRAI